MDVPKHGTVQVGGVASHRNVAGPAPEATFNRTPNPGSRGVKLCTIAARFLEIAQLRRLRFDGRVRQEGGQHRAGAGDAVLRHEQECDVLHFDAIYVYLRARSDGALSRQRPERHEPKTNAYTKAEDSCMG